MKMHEHRITGKKKATEDWIDTHCQETDTILNKNNSKKACQLVKDLTSEK